MKILVAKHRGVREWAGSDFDEILQSLSGFRIRRLTSDDEVYGNLPVAVAAAVVRQGARYFHLIIPDVSAPGFDFSSAAMRRHGAHWQEFFITSPASEHLTTRGE